MTDATKKTKKAKKAAKEDHGDTLRCNKCLKALPEGKTPHICTECGREFCKSCSDPMNIALQCPQCYCVYRHNPPRNEVMCNCIIPKHNCVTAMENRIVCTDCYHAGRSDHSTSKWCCRGCKRWIPDDDGESYRCKCNREFCDDCGSKMTPDLTCHDCECKHSSRSPKQNAYEDGCGECDCSNCDCKEHMEKQVICAVCEKKEEKKKQGTKRTAEEADLSAIPKRILSKLPAETKQTLSNIVVMSPEQIQQLPAAIAKQVHMIQAQLVTTFSSSSSSSSSSSDVSAPKSKKQRRK